MSKKQELFNYMDELLKTKRQFGDALSVMQNDTRYTADHKKELAKELHSQYCGEAQKISQAIRAITDPLIKSSREKAAAKISGFGKLTPETATVFLAATKMFELSGSSLSPLAFNNITDSFKDDPVLLGALRKAATDQGAAIGGIPLERSEDEMINTLSDISFQVDQYARLGEGDTMSEVVLRNRANFIANQLDDTLEAYI